MLLREREWWHHSRTGIKAVTDRNEERRSESTLAVRLQDFTAVRVANVEVSGFTHVSLVD